MGTTGGCWTQASTRWWCGQRDTFPPCVSATLECRHAQRSVTSRWPKRPSRGWRTSGLMEERSHRTSSCVSVLWGSGSFVPAPRPSTVAGSSSNSRPGGPGQPQPGEHEHTRDEGLWDDLDGGLFTPNWEKLTSGNNSRFQWNVKSMLKGIHHSIKCLSKTFFVLAKKKS